MTPTTDSLNSRVARSFSCINPIKACSPVILNIQESQSIPVDIAGHRRKIFIEDDFDLFIEKNGKVIWQWSKGKVFLDVLTPVIIPGGSFHEFPEIWSFSPEDIKEQGTYSARAIFIASKQEIKKNFEIKFVY